MPLRFGATPQDVEDLGVLGPVAARDTDFLGDVSQFHRLDAPMVIFREGRAIHFAASCRVAEVRFDTLNVFRETPETVLAALERANGRPAILQSGRLKYMALSVSTAGFYLDPEDRFATPAQDQDDRLIMTHAPGVLTVSERRPYRALSVL